MANLLTLEEKKYLQRICRYLGSLGMKHGSIDFEMEYGEFDRDDYNWNRITHFSNNYSAEIPDGLKEICKKLLQHVEESTISVVHDYNYYAESDTQSISERVQDDSDYDSLREVFEELENIEGLETRSLRLDYNGSGDSGYLEDSFTDGTDCPTSVSDYCYNMLENNFGGWEINEGSQGYFEMDLDNKELTLYHTSNIDEQGRDTIVEEDF